MSSEPSSSSPSTESQSSPTALPSRLPPITGNLAVDSLQSARHIAEVPCGRNSLLYGIGGGLGIGVIRGLSARPMVAGNWAVGTFVAISVGSWHLCQKQLEDQRRKVEEIIQAMPQRKVKGTPSDSSST